MLLIAIAVLLRPAVSMIANPYPFRDKQPDGQETPPMFLRGNPKFHYLVDNEGYTITKDDMGWYVYADCNHTTGSLVPTQWLVGDRTTDAQASLRPNNLPSAAVRQQECGFFCKQEDNNDIDGGMDFGGNRTGSVGGDTAKSGADTNADTAENGRKLYRPHGTTEPLRARSLYSVKRNLVLLLRFSNHAGRQLPSEADFDTLFNSNGPDGAVAPTGSIRDYFLANSYGSVVFESAVYSWLTLSKPESYYADGVSGLNEVFVEALFEGLDTIQSNTDISFADFDADGNGIVDSVTIVHSGYAAEFGQSDSYGIPYNDRIWSHKLYIKKHQQWTSHDGIKVDTYVVVPALWGRQGSGIGRIGVIAHELGHLLGLPDLYGGGTGDKGIGAYGIMGSAWGFGADQFHPPMMCPWSRIQVGWLQPRRIVHSGLYYIEASAVQGDVYRIDLGKEDDKSGTEYLLIENRQPLSFDSLLPQGGLAIWHIDERAQNGDPGHPLQSGWPQNGVHYRVALLQADGQYHLETGMNPGDASDLFHADGVKFSIGPSSDPRNGPFPNTDRYQGGDVGSTGVAIFDISPSGTQMSFRVSFPTPSASPKTEDSLDTYPAPTSQPVPTPASSPIVASSNLFSTAPSLVSPYRSLTTRFDGDTEQAGNMFDVMAHKTVFITSFEFHIAAAEGQVVEVEVYTHSGPFMNYETDSSGWKRIAVMDILSNGPGKATSLPDVAFDPIKIERHGIRAFYVTISNGSKKEDKNEKSGGQMLYGMGVGTGSLVISDDYLAVFEGVGVSYPFGQIYPERVWNGIVRYLPDGTAAASALFKRHKLVAPLMGGHRSAGIMFDVSASLSAVEIVGMALHIALEATVTFEVYTTAGTYHLGQNDDEPSRWTLVARDTVLGSGRGKETILPAHALPPIRIEAFQSIGLYVTLTTESLLYSDESRDSNGRPTPTLHTKHITVSSGAGRTYAFGEHHAGGFFEGILWYQVA